ncbi:hypothetical protein [Marinobacter nauticus]|uniref:hypothetical protein n=1 Tax=Marinobacter nauticus TaxID=2743 RepID=UPI001F2CEC8D|nr:hypothetical protein [Marinobacter nauticus]
MKLNTRLAVQGALRVRDQPTIPCFDRFTKRDRVFNAQIQLCFRVEDDASATIN